MTEKLDYTYSDLIGLTIDNFKTYYNNIDTMSEALTKNLELGSVNTNLSWTTQHYYNPYTAPWSVDHGPVTGDTSAANKAGVVKQLEVKMTWSRSTSSNPSVISSSTLKTALEAKTKNICGVDSIDEEVTAKGLLAYVQFISWLIKIGTIFMQPSTRGNEGLPCFIDTSFDTYPGLKRQKDQDYILKTDFDYIIYSLTQMAKTNALQDDPLTYSMPVSSSSSSCSSSSSSSSCSSSSSSSSSCSSSCSCWFLAYMKLV
jgi:hypothetical protein